MHRSVFCPAWSAAALRSSAVTADVPTAEGCATPVRPIVVQATDAIIFNQAVMRRCVATEYDIALFHALGLPSA